MEKTHYYVVSLDLPLLLFEGRISRQSLVEDWAERLEAQRQILGFLGLHEGSVSLSQAEAAPVIDERPRDYVTGAEIAEIHFYFDNRFGAETWREELEEELGEEFPLRLQEQEVEDWNQKWRESFKGIEIAPFWHILPSWQKNQKSSYPSSKQILINPGMGFGTGTHPTTQLCLRVLGRLPDLENWQVLDFGAGSGILSVAAAKRKAYVKAVEIDELAIENARSCLKLNRVGSRVELSQTLWEDAKADFDLVVANILRNVLMDYCEDLVAALKPKGLLYLSGLLEVDLYDVIPKYLLELSRVHQRSEEPEIHQNGSWYGLLFKA